MTYRYKTLIITVFICTLFSVSHAFSAGQSNSETAETTFRYTDLTYKVLTAGKTEETLYEAPQSDPNNSYLIALFHVYENNPATLEDIKNIVAALIYDITVIPSSKEIQYEWVEITRILAYLNLLAQPDETGQVTEAFTTYYAEYKTEFHTALADMAFTINTFPDNNTFWKELAGKEFVNVLHALSDHHNATTRTENTAFGHDKSILEECHNEEYLRYLFTTLGDPKLNWLATARLTHFILRYFNPYTSKNEPLIHQRNAIQAKPVAKKFLKKESNIALVKQSLTAVIKRMEHLDFPYWRYKAMEYTIGLLHTFQLDYRLPVTDEWLDARQMSTLSQNAKLVDWALAVEGTCPSISREAGVSVTCSTPPRKPTDPAIISTIATWHENDIHSAQLYKTLPMFYLAERLSLLGQLDHQELILNWESEPSIEETRQLSELRADAINTLSKRYP